MDASLLWLLAGLALIIAEVATGTFYLLFLGLAALVGAAVAYFGYSLPWQSLIASLTALAGMLWAHHRHRKDQTPAMPSVDLNQPVIWEGWVDRTAAMGRVKYRGASWDAHVHEDAELETGAVLYIVRVDSNTLHVSKNKAVL